MLKKSQFQTFLWNQKKSNKFIFQKIMAEEQKTKHCVTELAQVAIDIIYRILDQPLDTTRMKQHHHASKVLTGLDFNTRMIMEYIAKMLRSLENDTFGTFYIQSEDFDMFNNNKILIFPVYPQQSICERKNLPNDFADKLCHYIRQLSIGWKEIEIVNYPNVNYPNMRIERKINNSTDRWFLKTKSFSGEDILMRFINSWIGLQDFDNVRDEWRIEGQKHGYYHGNTMYMCIKSEHFEETQRKWNFEF